MTAEELTRVRRKDRQVDDEEWIEDYLTRAQTCVIGTVHQGRAFLNPNLFLFDREARTIFFHTAGRGRTRSNIEDNQTVTLCVFEAGRLLPAPDILDYSIEYASVVVFGRAEIVTDPATVRRVFDMQMQKYFPHHREGKDFRAFTDEEAARATVYRVTIERWSGKLHRAAGDHPGAWRFPMAMFP
jgi:nitroimidazol reductase NimA-like FMN-containing flavoprotein (pyridoxamine 5'-phosphate oxidase superfamily)